MTAVYNPKAFIPHAASLRQAFAHCRRFSTAATRRCLGSVSVPVSRVTLSRPVPIFALVSHYPTNKLIGRRTAPQAESHLWSEDIIRHYRQFLSAIPSPEGTFLRVTLPFAAVHSSEDKLLARLACLIHAANVHSEPGSNPSIFYAYHINKSKQ